VPEVEVEEIDSSDGLFDKGGTLLDLDGTTRRMVDCLLRGVLLSGMCGNLAVKASSWRVGVDGLDGVVMVCEKRDDRVGDREES